MPTFFQEIHMEDQVWLPQLRRGWGARRRSLSHIPVAQPRAYSWTRLWRWFSLEGSSSDWLARTLLRERYPWRRDPRASKIEKTEIHRGSSDIESFDSDLKWDVIALADSIYYVKVEKVAQVLTRAAGMLNADGYLLLRIHDFAKHREYIEVIRYLGSHVEHKDSLL